MTESGSKSTPLVLVHGAWQTAGTWDLVVPTLRGAGHQVFSAALTGLERDARDLTEDVTLDTHVEDVVRLLDGHGLQGVTLVGHSYAGMIITAVAERARSRLAHLVYVDAFIPSNGQSAMQLLPEAIQTLFRNQANAEGGGWRLRAGERQLDLWGLKEGPARDFVRSRLSDFSIRCFEQPIALPANHAASLERTYIACVADDYPARPIFGRFAAEALRDGWRYHELPTGHDCHAEMPEAFSKLLLVSRRRSEGQRALAP